METSIFIAKIMGLFGAISTLAIMLSYRKHTLRELEMAESVPSVVASGYFILMLGVLLVVSHNIWVKDWRVVVTILSWSTLAKGVLRIAFPDWVRKLVERKQQNAKFIFAELAVFLISLYLLYYGYIVY
ncbi:hypothetical protein KW796_01850 [Candidatus Parcubacteria bacterium]|nr:hypothetical protein [Candidatus Parcubacteria bacterium]